MTEALVIEPGPHSALRDGRPVRTILSVEDLEAFKASPTFEALVAFIEQLAASSGNNESGIAATDASPAVHRLMLTLNALEALIDAHPPVANENSRFGNPAFRDWHAAMADRAESWVADVIAGDRDADASSSSKTAQVREIAAYLQNAFGSEKRIDYGTGHEAHFLAFLYALNTLGLFSESDRPVLVLRVFWRYIAVMRRLQFAYWLEPAGSHGVWGLDDYHFLPFLFGAAQLDGHRYLRPKSIHDKDVLEAFSKDYMYLACVQSVNAIKSASLRWHSPMLDDISGAKSWSKVAAGMVKMYKAEVLGKLPIMQHFLFGTILPFAGSGVYSQGDAPCADGHLHVTAFGQLAPDCCGIKVPSAIAA
ncbi:Phosphotyrosyl phosphatase activator, partial [Caulochytrium protostelioides]